MKADDFKCFFAGGRYDGQAVLVQLKTPGTFLAQLDRRGSLELKTVQMAPEVVEMQLEATVSAAEKKLGRKAEPAEIASVRARLQAGEPLQPVPVLIGTLSPVADSELLMLEYKDGASIFRVTLAPDDIQHVTVASASRIVT